MLQIDVGLVHWEAVGGLRQLLQLGLGPSMGQGQYDELHCWLRRAGAATAEPFLILSRQKQRCCHHMSTIDLVPLML